MKSSRQRITDPGHVSGVAAAGPLSCYIYAVCENSVNNRVWINFFFRTYIIYIYNIVLYTVLYIFILYARPLTTLSERVCTRVTTTVR